MQLRVDYLEKEPVETVYFGGGTPSLLDESELESILGKLQSLFRLSPGAEITLEANPDDVNERILRSWKKSGINRLSIGVQSFFEEDLVWMNRAHNAKQSCQSIESSLAEGFSLSIDLIYGAPVMDDTRWKANVEKAIALHVPHISCYALTVEPRTALEHFIRTKQVAPVDQETQARQFLQLMEWMEDAGYEHYEISNFSLPGMRSRHNSSYWKGCKYLGLGPSAHSFDGKSRQWNIANNAQYIASLGTGEIPFEKEILTPLQQLNEYIMTSLRTGEGLNLESVQSRFGKEPSEVLIRKAEKHIGTQSMSVINSTLVLTKKGKLFADGIAADLFFSEQD